MSSTSLPFVQAQLIRYGTTTIMVFGCIGNAYVVFLFSKHHKNACALYLLNTALMNIIYLGLSIPLTAYTNDHGDPSLNSMALCKLRFYLFHVWGQISRYCIVFACIDRFALTNANAKIRKFSNVSIARVLIIIIIIFWHVFAIHIVVMTTIQSGRCGYFGLYYTLNSIYVLIFNCFIPPILMTIFGYLSFRNVKRLHSRVQPGGTNSETAVIHQKDRSLLSMLLAEVSVYVVTMSLYPIILLETAVTSPMNASKSTERIQIENFILFFSTFLIYLNTSAPFYIYCIVSKSFRNDFKASVKRCWQCLTRQ